MTSATFCSVRHRPRRARCVSRRAASAPGAAADGSLRVRRCWEDALTALITRTSPANYTCSAIWRPAFRDATPRPARRHVPEAPRAEKRSQSDPGARAVFTLLPRSTEPATSSCGVLSDGAARGRFQVLFQMTPPAGARFDHRRNRRRAAAAAADPLPPTSSTMAPRPRKPGDVARFGYPIDSSAAATPLRRRNERSMLRLPGCSRSIWREASWLHVICYVCNEHEDGVPAVDENGWASGTKSDCGSAPTAYSLDLRSTANWELHHINAPICTSRTESSAATTLPTCSPRVSVPQLLFALASPT